MTCAQLRTKTRTSISRQICGKKSEFQILYTVEQFSSLFPRQFSLYAIELSSNCFSEITVIHDISKQIEQRARVGKIFARWH